MKQAGVSFLEVVIVVGILGITSAFVAPNFTGWRSKSNLASDYRAVVAHVDYLKTRARVLNGTATLTCVSPTQLTSQVSTAPQHGTATVGPTYSANIVEDPATNILSGNTTVSSQLCNNLRGVFISNGQVGMEGSGGALDIELNTNNDRTRGAYRILVNQTTGFVQKYKWSGANNSWIELD